MLQEQRYTNSPFTPLQERISAAPNVKQMLEQARSIRIDPRYRNEKGELLVSPNGPASNLSEQNWKLVRTPAFKEWFGDWESPKTESFITSQGSTYTYDEEGKTRRYKKATNELHETQDITVFLDLTWQDEQRVLHAYRKVGDPSRWGKVYIVERQMDDTAKRILNISQIQYPDRVYLAIVQDGKTTWHKPASIKPAIGLLPFDMRHNITENDGTYSTERHLGNPITEIKTDCSSVIQNGEPKALDNGDGTLSFVHMKNPYALNTKEDVELFFQKHHIVNHPDRYKILMKSIRASGFDGLTLNGKPVRFKDGSYSIDEKNQMIKV